MTQLDWDESENIYPTEEQLEELVVLGNDVQNVDKFLDKLTELWHWPDWGIVRTNKFLTLHTGGWSGNESIIMTIEQTMFWLLYWRLSKRGGHYYFKINA